MNNILSLQRLWIHQVRTMCKPTFPMPTSCIVIDKPGKLPPEDDFCKFPVPQYGGRYVVSMITGGGIGPELMDVVKEIFCYVAVPIDFEEIQVLSQSDIEHAFVSIKRNRAAITSNIRHKTAGAMDASANVIMRRDLDLYLNMVRCKPYCGLVKAKHSDVDVILVRQNTEGEYALLEHESKKGVVESLKIITKLNSERVARRAFELATLHNRKKVTVVHKANIMKLSDGLFLRQAIAVSKNFPNIKQESMLVDNCCMQIVQNPKQFDILIMPNQYGSILTNILCGILGGPGLFAGSNYGEKYAVFEPATRSIGIDLIGKNIVNPVAMLNAAVELLYHLRLLKLAGLIDKAVYKTVCEDNIQSRDLGGECCTSDVVEAVKRNIDLLKSQKQVKCKSVK